MAKKEPQGRQNSVVGYVLKFAGDRKKQYVKSMILAFLGVLFSLAPYLLMGEIVKKLIDGEKDFTVYLTKTALMAVCWVVRVLLHTASTNTSHKATFQVLANVRTALCDKLSRVPLGTVLDIPSGSMKNIIVERVDSMETVLAHVVPEFTANLSAPILMFIYLLTIDWRMALTSLLTLPIGAACLMLMFRDYERLFKRTQDTTKALNDTAVEYINGIEVIKVFGKAESSYQRFVDAAKENAASFTDWMRGNIGLFSVMMTVTPLTLLSTLPIGAVFVKNGSLALSDFIMIIILSCGLIVPLITAMSYTDDIGKATAIFGDVDRVLNLKELKRPHHSLSTPRDASVRLSDVHFGYKDQEVLHGIDLDLPAGSVTALVGPSGSGKSTIARLIASLWDTDKGTIEIGGVDIRKIALQDYNRLIAYVSQDNFLFDTTIRENIRMGREGATDAQVEQVAKESGCYDLIMKLEKGFDTKVGGSGAHLSGGERQRIAIARAMMKDAPIVILDEATAYTDPENEALIQRSVARLVQGKTLIVIAHRLSTIIDSDAIVLVNKGKIEAKGTHDELLASSELYRRMWEAHMASKDTAMGGVSA